MKVKGYWPQASTDEPQVLALAELLQDAKIIREDDVLLAVKALAQTESAKKNEFRPTPSMICDMTVTLRRERYQQDRARTPTGVNPDGHWYDTATGQLAQEFDPTTGQLRPKQVASPERRDKAMAQIKAMLSGGAFSLEPNQYAPTPSAEHDTPQSEIGGGYTLANAERLDTESRRVGVPDTEDEMLQYRFTFDPPESWRLQPICGPWVNTQSQAIQDGRTWLNTANRRH